MYRIAMREGAQPIARAPPPRLVAAHREHGAAHQAHEARHGLHADRDHEVRHALADEGDHEQREQDGEWSSATFTACMISASIRLPP